MPSQESQSSDSNGKHREADVNGANFVDDFDFA